MRALVIGINCFADGWHIYRRRCYKLFERLLPGEITTILEVILESFDYARMSGKSANLRFEIESYFEWVRVLTLNESR